jgi:hypothetical protein
MATSGPPDAESLRLAEDGRREKNWKRWGPYLAERQWATVREDYSEEGNAWEYFSHEHSGARAYRWGEDGLLGICDRECRLCFSVSLWNGADPFLKERLFGLTGRQGNHGEDVKECYFYLDATPTHSYLKGLYKYPQQAFPYAGLIRENAKRAKSEREYELIDTGIFDQDRYFDIFVEYAKASPDDILIRITAANRGAEPATLHLLPTFWFRNTWSWGRTGEGYWPKPRIALRGQELLADHASLGVFRIRWSSPEGRSARVLFTENETNAQRLFGSRNESRGTKDGFNQLVVNGDAGATTPDNAGTKAALYSLLELPAHGAAIVKLRLTGESAGPSDAFGSAFDALFEQRIAEADVFYRARSRPGLTDEELRVTRQAYAGLLWSKMFYHLDVKAWFEGDPAQPAPAEKRKLGRNRDWKHLYNRDVVSVPDKWEYPWYAAWDLAFHMLPFATIDPELAKDQLILLLREWYMHPNGQIPAYEFDFSDANPPVHAWAVWRVYKIAAARGARDHRFLLRAFEKLLLSFTWWVNRKDAEGRNLFSGGFLGLDNVGVFDRSKLAPGSQLDQADGTAWMASYCATMLAIALELARWDIAHDDIASKFFEHFVAIADAINSMGGKGLWDEEDGFYYDLLRVDGRSTPLRVRSIVGLIPMLAVEPLEQKLIDRLPGFKKRMEWFLKNRPDLARHITYMEPGSSATHGPQFLLALPSRPRLERLLRYALDENEFYSNYGIRSLSRIHKARPYVGKTGSAEGLVAYEPGESTSGLFGGNSNWRGPVWFPINYLLIEALERYHHFYGESLKVECPTGSGKWMTLAQVAHDLSSRLARLFLPDVNGNRPCFGGDRRFADDPHWRDLLYFHEYFHGDNGAGLGASHQTGWTALVIRCIEDAVRGRTSHHKYEDANRQR